MSTPQQPSGDPPDPGYHRSSIGRAFKRIKTAFRPGRPSRQSSTDPAPAATSSSSAIVPVTAPPLEEESTTVQPSPLDPEITIGPLNNLVVDDDVRPNPIIEPPNAALYLRGAVQRERARALFEKYGLSFDGYDWIPQAPPTTGSSSIRTGVLRIEKPIRMRIRYICHRCEHTFGSSPKCSNCEHLRCKKCPRQPLRRRRDDMEEEDRPTTPAEASVEPHHEGSPRRRRRSTEHLRQATITMPGVRPRSDSDGSQPVLMQRIRYTCHKCETDFIPATAHICPNCGHLRCSKCSRAPSIAIQPLDHLDDGEAADTETARSPSKRPDRVYRKPRQRLRWKCDNCSNLFQEGSKVCSECLHKRCERCTRIPPKQPHAPEPEPDPRTLSSVQARLEGLNPLQPPIPALQQPPAVASSST